MGTAIATGTFAKNGFIPWKQSGFCVVSALIGSAIGANLALVVADVVFKRILLVVLPLTGIYVVRKKVWLPIRCPIQRKRRS